MNAPGITHQDWLNRAVALKPPDRLIILIAVDTHCIHEHFALANLPLEILDEGAARRVVAV